MMSDELEEISCCMCQQLRHDVHRLTEEIEKKKSELGENIEKLNRLQRLYERGALYIEDLHIQVRILNAQVQANERSSNISGTVTTVAASVQTDLTLACNEILEKRASISHDHDDGEQENYDGCRQIAIVTDFVPDNTSINIDTKPESTVLSEWVTQEAAEEGEIVPVEPQSIADSVREAAEAAQLQSGYVYDKSTGLYYDKQTGYYYDAEKSLYYEPYSGTYYYFDADTHEYVYHSRADLAEYSTGAYNRYYQNVTGDKPKKKKKSQKEKPEDRKLSKSDLKRKESEMSEDYDSRKKKHKKEKRTKEEDKDRVRTKHRHKSHRSRNDDVTADCGGKSSSKASEATPLEPGEICVQRTKSSNDNSSRASLEQDDDSRSTEYGERPTDGSPSRVTRRSSQRSVGRGVSHSRGDSPDTVSSSRTHRTNTDRQHRMHATSKKDHRSHKYRSSRNGLDSDDSKNRSKKKSSLGYKERGSVQNSASEDGEISTSSSGHDGLPFVDRRLDSSSEEECDSSTSEEAMPDVSARNYPPCIRVMVLSSDVLDVGCLYVITYTGATIGREKELNHAIHIPDEKVSKMHCDILYNDELRRYEVRDHASQNGTAVNGHRLSEPKVLSEPYPLAHTDTLTVGATTLDLHIHPGTLTCDGCEPGLIMAKLQQQQKDDPTGAEPKPDKDRLRRSQLKQIKKKYGLGNSGYVDDEAAIKNPAYQDKANLRRQTVGSDNPYQRDDAPASVNRAIPTENKGHKLLAKMGWKEGDSLGRSQAGIREPIQASIRTNQAAGLGSFGSYGKSLDNIREVRATEKWVKAQDRFNKLQGHDATEALLHIKPKTNPMHFTKGKTETFRDGSPSDRTDQCPDVTDEQVQMDLVPEVTAEQNEQSSERSMEEKTRPQPKPSEISGKVAIRPISWNKIQRGDKKLVTADVRVTSAFTAESSGDDGEIENN